MLMAFPVMRIILPIRLVTLSYDYQENDDHRNELNAMDRNVDWGC
jgi:hypothetical protein